MSGWLMLACAKPDKNKKGNALGGAQPISSSAYSPVVSRLSRLIIEFYIREKPRRNCSAIYSAAIKPRPNRLNDLRATDHPGGLGGRRFKSSRSDQRFERPSPSLRTAQELRRFAVALESFTFRPRSPSGWREILLQAASRSSIVVPDGTMRISAGSKHLASITHVVRKLDLSVSHGSLLIGTFCWEAETDAEYGTPISKETKLTSKHSIP